MYKQQRILLYIIPVFLLALVLFGLVLLFKTVRIVPQQTSLIIERLGKYHRTLEGGIHILVPFVEEIVPEIDEDARVVVVTPPPGLLDLARPDAPDAPDDSAALEATDPAEAN